MSETHKHAFLCKTTSDSTETKNPIRKYLNGLPWKLRWRLDPECSKVMELSRRETAKRPLRTDIINRLLGLLNRTPTTYLEIGVRNPDDNFSHIRADQKISVDPGVEFSSNPVTHQLTSDAFFSKGCHIG